MLQHVKMDKKMFLCCSKFWCHSEASEKLHNLFSPAFILPFFPFFLLFFSPFSFLLHFPSFLFLLPSFLSCLPFFLSSPSFPSADDIQDICTEFYPTDTTGILHDICIHDSTSYNICIMWHSYEVIHPLTVFHIHSQGICFDCFKAMVTICLSGNFFELVLLMFLLTVRSCAIISPADSNCTCLPSHD